MANKKDVKYQKKFEKLVLKNQFRTAVLTQRALNKILRTGIETAGINSLAFYVDSQREVFQSIIENIISRNIADSVNFAITENNLTGLNFDDEILKFFSRERSTEIAPVIKNTTIKRINKSLLKANKLGLDENAKTKFVKRFMLRSNRIRANTIAITEGHRIANKTVIEIGKSLNVPTRKQWITSQDEATREWHNEADGQIVDINQPFLVGGELLESAGQGSSFNSINCRCATILLFDK